MFEEDRSAARPEMETRKLYIFKHESVLGNARFPDLEKKVQITLKDGITVPRRFEDYDIKVDENIPEGVTLIVR